MTWWLLVLSFVTLLLSVLVVGLLQSHAAMVRALDGLGADFGEHTRPGVGDAAVEPAGDERAATSLVAAEGGAVGMAARDVIGTDVSGNPIAIAVTRVERHTLLAEAHRRLIGGTTRLVGHRDLRPLVKPAEQRWRIFAEGHQMGLAVTLRR